MRFIAVELRAICAEYSDGFMFLNIWRFAPGYGGRYKLFRIDLSRKETREPVIMVAVNG